MELSAPLKRGDGLVLDAGKPQETEQGGSVFDVLVQRAPRGVEGRQRQTRGGRSTSAAAFQPLPSAESAGPGQTVAVVFGGGQLDARRVQVRT
jgi:hypothetical protein